MTIKVGDTIPDATLTEFIEVEGNGCTVGPNAFKVSDMVKGKKIAVFGLPGAFTSPHRWAARIGRRAGGRWRH